MTITYKTQGVCARSITFDKDESGKITNISFDGGCNGNLKAISKLCDGMTADEIVANTDGISEVNAADIEDVQIYNLQGVRMNSLKKGLNIVNGKKIVIK
jgi:uncharacterized protein (TIGR03905 family)